MKHAFLLLLSGLLLLAVTPASAQCVPDTTIGDSVGLYPSLLADGVVGQPYNQVINIIFPQDTVITSGTTTLNPDFCSFRIDSVPNLPGGMSYACNTPNCVWVIDHTPGVINRGCITISGTPADTIAGDSLAVYVNASVGFFNSSVNSCLPITLPPPFDTLTAQEYRTRFKIQQANRIDQEIALQYNLRTLTTGQQMAASFELPAAGMVQVDMLDLMGRVIAHTDTRQMAAGVHTLELSRPANSTGVYLTRLWVNGVPVAVNKWVATQ